MQSELDVQKLPRGSHRSAGALSDSLGSGRKASLLSLLASMCRTEETQVPSSPVMARPPGSALLLGQGTPVVGAGQQQSACPLVGAP